MKYKYIIMLIGIFVVISALVYASPTQKGYTMYKYLEFRVSNDTNTEISALGVGDVNGDGKKDLLVVYDNLSFSELALYKINSQNVVKFSSLKNFKVGESAQIFIEPRNTILYDINGDGRDEIIIYGSYSNLTGVFILSYQSSSIKIIKFFNGTDCDILTIGNNLYLVVGGSGIYRINNGNFVYINGTENIKEGFVRTGEFSNSANIVVLQKSYLRTTLTYYSFSNDTLRIIKEVNVNIEVNGWGNDAVYTDGFTVGNFYNSNYDSILLVTYHNGYAIYSYNNGEINQTVNGTFDVQNENAMSCKSSKIFGYTTTDRIIVGFDNYKNASLYRIYSFENNTMKLLYSESPSPGSTRILCVDDLNNDGVKDVIVGSVSIGYVRAFTETYVPEVTTNSLLIILVVGVIFLKLRQ